MASAIIGALAGLSFGFRTTFSVTFEKILPALKIPGSTKALPPVVIPLPTIVPVSRAFYEADVSIVMPQAGGENHFILNIYGLGNDLFSLLDPEHTLVHISLGYADGSSSEVMAGLLTEKRLSVASDNCFYQAELKGVDYVFDQLQYPAQNITAFTSDKGQTIGQIAGKICDAANVAKQIKADGPPIDPLTFDDATPLAVLQSLAKRGGYALQIKDGKVWMGAPADLGTDHPLPITDGTTSKPVTARGGTPAASPSDGQDFDMAGDSTIRPNDTVNFGKSKYRIESVTHKLTRNGGYRCSGRALGVDATVADQKMGGKPAAALVGRAIQDKLDAREQSRPAVSAGEVGDYTEGKHTASVNVGAAPTPDMSNPTVQAPLRKDPGKLPDKPIASPFAFGPCGLVVPVYSKMRTLLVHGWNDPNDAVVDGFLWTKDMTPPPNKAGDWWLCLPTQLDADGLPTGATTDDLTARDGQRVISVKGMRITIGSGLLNQTGSRPAPGSDESLIITTDQGAKLTVKGSQIQMTDGSVTLTVGSGKVSIS
jgi:hypothetical protein